jgi:hypothetical protein
MNDILRALARLGVKSDVTQKRTRRSPGPA